MRGPIAFCFPGQGSLEAGMGREIAEAFPEAMEVFRIGSEASGLDLQHLCFEGHEDELVDTAVQQPALVATSLAVLAALKARGIEPDYVVGHSVGEFAALGAANALSTEEALALVRERGLAMAEAAGERPGSMAAILGLEDPVVERLCRQIIGVWPANYNCPGQIVVSGENPAVDECCDQAVDEGARRAVKLRVSGAFHSPLVAHAAERIKPAVDRIKFNDPSAPFMSTVTAKIEPAHRMAGLLVEQLTAPVKFTQAASELAREGVRTFVEVGPGNVLSGLLRRIDSTAKAILVNNAGLTRDGLLARMPDEDWRDVIETNLSSVFYTCRASARQMMKRRAGAIVNVSSVVGLHGNPGQTNYAASKAGIIGFTKSLARELGSRGVRANVVAPGYITSRLTEEISEEMRSLMLQNTPLGRLGDPENVAGAVRFLCSDEAAFITGEVLLVDGGLGM